MSSTICIRFRFVPKKSHRPFLSPEGKPTSNFSILLLPLCSILKSKVADERSQRVNLYKQNPSKLFRRSWNWWTVDDVVEDDERKIRKWNSNHFFTETTEVQKTRHPTGITVSLIHNPPTPWLATIAMRNHKKSVTDDARNQNLEIFENKSFLFIRCKGSSNHIIDYRFYGCSLVCCKMNCWIIVISPQVYRKNWSKCWKLFHCIQWILFRHVLSIWD